MQTVLTRPPQEFTTQAITWRDCLRGPERVALFFFALMAVQALVRHLHLLQCATLTAVPIGLYKLWRLETLKSRQWSRVVRDLSNLGLILVAYWALEWFTAPPRQDLEALWIGWDRTLLHDFGLQRAIESAGGLFPAVLETLYLLLYAIPAVALGFLYVTAGRSEVKRFTLVLLLGTFTAYALIPLWPVSSPRSAFPQADAPHYAGPARKVNTYILDRLDITTGVFPSGHCAVAFSAAFGMFSALKKRRRLWMPFFGVATLVYLATIYGRYHFAIDGAASILIATASWILVEAGLLDET